MGQIKMLNSMYSGLQFTNMSSFSSKQNKVIEKHE